MTIKSLFLRNFRNYKECLFHFSPKINVICGNNAQGKSNLLEAIYVLITGHSFRTPHLLELIRFGEPFFYIEALFEKNGIEQTLKFSYDGNERKVFHNATSLTHLSSLFGILNGIIFSPEDRHLVKGPPQGRRQFLDLQIAQANPLYLHHLSRYIKGMKQRNVLLKRRSLETISIWEEQMATAAAYLTQVRAQATASLESLTQRELLGKDRFGLSYHSKALVTYDEDIEEIRIYYLKQFEKHRKREMELGMTLSGPHRDDLFILVEGKEARQFASEGQQRSCIASLKLAQWKWLASLVDAPPSLCIDDVAISFDPSREEELYQRVQQLGQVFITSARPTSLLCHLIEIRNGNLIDRNLSH